MRKFETFLEHLASRNLRVLEEKCMKHKCPICEYWALRIDLFDKKN